MSRAAPQQLVLEQLVRDTPGLWRGRDHGREAGTAAEGLTSTAPGTLAAVPDARSGGTRSDGTRSDGTQSDGTQSGGTRSGIPGDDVMVRHVFDTGHPALNDLLPTGGWPRRSVIEIVAPAWGSGELQPFLPLMARLTAAGSEVALVAPPFQPYAPALVQGGVDLAHLLVVAPEGDPGGGPGGGRDGGRDAWWAAEKLLRQGDAALVLLWPGPDARDRAGRVRRLQLAADRAGGIGVILGCGPVVDSPVGLRLRVGRGWTCRDGDGPAGDMTVHMPVTVSLTKSRYGWCRDETVELPPWRPGT